VAQHLRLEARGVIERNGNLIDATIVEAAITPWWGKTRRSLRATPRPVGPKNRKSPFGYKAHIAVEQASGIIRGAILSSADLHDSQAGPALVQSDDAALYADKAYDRKLRDALAAAGITDGIMHKARRKYPTQSLTALVQQGGRADPLRRRTQLRHHEAVLWLPARQHVPEGIRGRPPAPRFEFYTSATGRDVFNREGAVLALSCRRPE
jgi:IS5 family transposase